MPNLTTPNTLKTPVKGLVGLLFETRFDGSKVKTFVGEDYAFCDKYMDLYWKGVFDHPIWVWPDITFDHDGYIGNFHEQFEDRGLHDSSHGNEIRDEVSEEVRDSA